MTPPHDGPKARITALEHALGTVEEGRRRLTARVRQMPPEAQQWRPPRLFREPGWSPLQVLDHLARVDGLTAEALRKGLPEGTKSSPSPGERVGEILVRMVFRVGLRVRAPMERVKPPDDVSLTEVLRSWYDAGEALRDAALEVKDPGQARVRYPVAGPMSTLEALSFLKKHQQHHGRQLDRIQARPEFPWAVR